MTFKQYLNKSLLLPYTLTNYASNYLIPNHKQHTTTYEQPF